MKKSLFPAVLAASLVLMIVVGFHVRAQSPTRPAGPPASGPNVALLDVDYVFGKYVHFNGMMNDLKQDLERADNELKSERDAIKKLMPNLARFKNTADYKPMEEEIAKRQGDLQVRFTLQRKEFQPQRKLNRAPKMPPNGTRATEKDLRQFDVSPYAAIKTKLQESVISSWGIRIRTLTS